MKHKSQLKRKSQDQEAAMPQLADMCRSYLSHRFFSWHLRTEESSLLKGWVGVLSGISAPEGTNILVTLSRSEPVIRGQEVEHFANRMSAWAKD
jgi:hypothetical protein